MDTTLTPPSRISLSRASLYWLKLGFISFGGACGPDRHHAPRSRRAWSVDRGKTFPSCLEFLYGLARARSAATCNLCRLAYSWHVGMAYCRRPVRAAVFFHTGMVKLDLPGLWHIMCRFQ